MKSWQIQSQPVLEIFVAPASSPPPATNRIELETGAGCIELETGAGCIELE